MGKYQDIVRKMFDNERRANKLSFDEAAKRTRETLADFQPDALEDLDNLIEEHKVEVAQATKLSEKSTAFIRDDMARGWYTPHTTPGGVWERLKERMSQGGLAGAVNSIDRSSDAIVAHLAEPNVTDDKRRGLVIGNVQSGKTANYAAVISKALDEGYKLVIVLSGIHSNLRKQTQSRLERDLGVDLDSSEWHRLTSSEDGDMGRTHIKNAANIVNLNKRVLAVVKKNSRRLENLRDFLRAVDSGTMRNTPVLLIDDESDQATPDSSAVGADSPTAINQRMREIWQQVNNGTYAGYTATPFANVFIDPEAEKDLYPSDFLNVMPTPETYFGAERLFGLDDPDSAPDVIRYIDQAELEYLRPQGRGHIDSFESQITPSLEDAIRWFIIGAAVRRLRGQSGEHSTMLIHTTHRVEPHFLMRNELNAFLNPLRNRALDGRVEDFYTVFHKEMNRAAGLYTGHGPAPTWPAVRNEIPNVLRTLKVSVDNGSAEAAERLNYETDSPQTVIVIGGGTLSRGLTLEGLYVSFFTRTSNAYDTLLQMGRWFGYRQGYEDLQRIWVSEGLDSEYRFLASVEADLRVEVERMRAAGQRPSEIGLRIQQHPGRLEITSKNKMKHVEKVSVDFEGYRLQTTVFDISQPDILSSTADYVREFLRDVMRFAYRTTDRSERHAVLFHDVPSSEVLGFLDKFNVHNRYEQLLRDTVAWTRDKLPHTPWNVVVASGSGDEEYSIGDVSVCTVNRAPLDKKGNHPTEIDIRALMSAGDLVADLAVLRPESDVDYKRLKNKEQFDRRRDPQGAAGRGLLVIYPISRTFDNKSINRMSMRAALGEDLAKPGAPPIFGIGVVAPFDIDGSVRDKGNYVAVRTQETDEADEPIEQYPVDNERDHGSGPR